MSKFRNIVKKTVVIGLCICTFSVQVSGATPWSSANGIFYDGNGNEIKGAIAKGIDVSYHNGDIDWAKVKAAGISFALLRCGYGNDERNQDDIKFVQNVKGCEDNGIQYGVYLYSYAVDNDKEKTLEDMARSEAEHVLRMIEEAGAKPTMPVYYDIEDKSQVGMTDKQYGDMAEIFCNIVKNAGYKVGVYSNYYWWINRLTDSRFDNWGKWVARYNNTSEYNKEYDIWQYTESGTVDGVGSGMDVNILLSRPCSITGHQYEFYQLVSKSTTTINGKATYKCKTCGHIKTTDIAKISQITISKTKYEYTGKAFKPTVTVKDSNGQVISTQNYNIIYSSNKKVGNGTVKIVAVQQTVIAALDADHAEALVQAGTDHGTDSCVHAGGIAAAGENTDRLDLLFHREIPSNLFLHIPLGARASPSSTDAARLDATYLLWLALDKYITKLII